MKKFLILMMAFLCILGLAACNKSSKKSGDAEIIQPVEAFYDAIVTQNRDRVGSIACSAWEKNALMDVDSFMGVKSEMKGFSCTVQEKGKDEATVVCTGAIAASYGAEVTEFPVDKRIHKVIKEQGEWRICGY